MLVFDATVFFSQMQARQKHPQANVGLEVDRGNDDWIVVDTGDILVQLFSPGARRCHYTFI